MFHRFYPVFNIFNKILQLTEFIYQRESEAKHQALDTCADKIITAIYQAMELSTPCRQNSGWGEPWWNKDCRAAVAELRKTKKRQGINAAAQIEDLHSDDIVADYKRKLRKVVKEAKRKYFQNVIDGLDNHNIFQTVKWPRSVRQYSTLPIRQVDGTLAVNNLEKQATLRKELLSLVDPLGDDTTNNEQAPNLNEEKIGHTPAAYTTPAGPATSTTSTGHGRELSNLAKIYTDDAKYSGRNDSFTFKLAIFHDICSRADVPTEAKMKAFPTMLKGLALDNYSSNIGISGTVMNSDQIRYSIRRKWMKWDKTKDEMDETRIGVG